MIYIDFKYCDTAGIVNMEMTEWLKQHIGAGRPCWRRRCRGLAASSPQVQFYGVCAREVELLVIKLAVGDLVEREGRAY